MALEYDMKTERNSIATKHELRAHAENRLLHGGGGIGGPFYKYNADGELCIIALPEGEPDPDMEGFPDGTIVVWYEP